MVTRDQLTEEYHELSLEGIIREQIEREQFVENRKPYWMNLTGGTSWGGELRFELENYFPAAHYQGLAELKAKDRAVNRILEEESEESVTDRDTDMLPDGGPEVYVWKGRNGALYHQVHDQDADVFHHTEDEAENFLQRLDEDNPEDDFSRYTMYRANLTDRYKVKEASEVLTQQGDLFDF